MFCNVIARVQDQHGFFRIMDITDVVKPQQAVNHEEVRERIKEVQRQQPKVRVGDEEVMIVHAVIL